MAKKTTDDNAPGDAPASTEITEAEISAKIQAGLTRDQAIEVINNQRAHDATL